MRTAWLASACVVLGTVAAGGVARADEALACARAAEDAQTLRSAARLTRARERLLSCVRDVCPRVVRHDCVRWLAEVDGALPSVVFRARASDGSDLTDVRVYLDGVAVAGRLDGLSVPVDPGTHALRYVGSGGETVETRVLVAEGEQHRVLAVTLPDTRRSTGPIAATRPVSALTWALGGVAVGGAAAFAVLTLTGASDFGRLKDGCGRTQSCTDGQVSGARAQYLAADIALGVGVAALGGAAWSFLTRGASPPTAGLVVTPLGGGALAGWRGTF